MITLQSHNQVLYHLTQLTSAFTPRTSTYTTRVKKQHQATATKTINHICSKNFVKNSTASLENLDVHTVLETRHLNGHDINVITSKQINHVPRSIDAHDGWKISYISGSTFDDNKRGLLNSLNGSKNYFGLSNNNFYATTLLANDIIARGFKTQRNVTAEIARNPSMAGRFRSWIGLSKFADEKPKATIERTDLENLRSILNNTNLSIEDKKHVKVAFAEGYLAGNDRKVPGRGFKWLRLIQQFTMTVVAFVILLSILASTNGGSMFRIPLGSHAAVDPEEINVTFDDVKGVNEAKQELADVVEFLKNPDKFSALGGRLPKGVLLVGPPGTGKTLLARAVAGEAKVPFFHAAGPEFDEILVGQGARRVRDLFKAAKERAPCVVFIDEIDSVGGKRTTSVIHPYANQTINQLLTEMDGFQHHEGVIVLGATNRRDDLDAALRRPGRFDIEVYVHKPDLNGRKEILGLYLAKVLTKTLDIESLARSTMGFTGADIETMVNQAALRAAIEGADHVTMEHLEKAREKVLLGPELKGRMPDKEETKITAYHEAGHALVGYYSKDGHALTKVTVIPRAGSLGHTSYVPKKDVYHVTKSQLLATMDAMMGGRAAEELIFGPDKVTTGASSDLQRATEIAETMVKNYGMSEKVGVRAERESNNNESGSDYSPNTTELIDGEVKRLLQESYERAKNILKTHAKEHKLLAESLIKYETLDVEDVKAILTGKKSPAETITDKPRPIVDVPTIVI
ncbi:ATP-dependent zinc metalloprotease YME1L [Aphidius gifuensis]|uniref:ATP-dependent zinc metalloprotease YME1L n=1 Tax=Aphidius gifuensis TaxID=684658 RepID=UPI001CDCC3D1|nr:ATP-dependent zinc metalloprotease YME1L [Aphidius gifuensis]